MKIKQILKCQKGSMFIGPVIVLMIILAFAALTVEVLRINSIKEAVGGELYRAVNVSVQAAVYDSMRADTGNELDTEHAYAVFYEYMFDRMKLEGSHTVLSKTVNGDTVYTMTISNLSVDPSSRMHVKGLLEIESMFSFLTKVYLPIDVVSRNTRFD